MSKSNQAAVGAEPWELRIPDRLCAVLGIMSDEIDRNALFNNGLSRLRDYPDRAEGGGIGMILGFYLGRLGLRNPSELSIVIFEQAAGRKSSTI